MKSSQVKNFLTIYIMVAIISIFPFIYIYLEMFGMELSIDHQRWAGFGDYIGGVLTPVLAFVSFLALLHTIIIQKSELELTRKELRKSASAQEDTAKFAELQNKLANEQFAQLKRNEEKNDLYRLIESIENKIEARLNKSVGYYLSQKEVSLQFLIIKLIEDIDSRPHGLREKVGSKYDIDFDYIFFQIKELLSKSVELKKLTGSNNHYSYYERMYEKELKLFQWLGKEIR